MTTYFPSELLLKIVGHLSKSKLRELCFVSRDWLNVAQVGLFRTVRVNMVQKSAQDLIAFRQSSPHLRTYVNQLHLFGRGSMELPPMNIGDLFKVLQLLPAIRCLKLYRVSIAGPVEVTDDLVSSQPELKLMLSNFQSGVDVLDTILTRLHPTELHLQHVIVDPSDEFQPPFRQDAFKGVRVLNIGGVYNSGAPRTRWTTSDILAICPVDTLTTFGLGYDIDRHQHGEELRRFLETKGRHVECLNIDYGHWTVIEPEAEKMRLMMDDVGRDGFGGTPSEWPTIKLSTCCPALKHITFFLFVEYESPDDSKKSSAIYLWRYALRLISTAPKNLISITVLFDLGGNVPYEDLDRSTIYTVNWEKWDEVLRGFEKLERVSFVPLGFEGRAERETFAVPATQPRVSDWPEEASEFVYKQLSSLHKRNVEFRFA
ncbi:hypothetical protein EIP91_003758 [Steccherinum ochraceum]|uniref:F-box domain-containing protein n=1 Tax=Steccherinum ochraceum TaxID=92696 RepID=A0A4R0RGB7_9APHY|nr:hypothetical protein EIP91_003758 [Steccherinum ochraceum]